MANFELTRDLWTDALFLAGELTDGTSLYGTPQYGGKTLDYLNAVYRLLYTGGSLGGVRIPTHDWLWARPYPRAAINLESAWAGTGTLLLTSGSAVATLNAAPPSGISLAQWRLLVRASSAAGNEEPWMVTVSAHTADTVTVTMDSNWPYPTGTATNGGGEQFLFARTDYVTSRMLRPVGPLWLVTAPGYIPLTSPQKLDELYPLSTIKAGTPEAAALVAQVASDLGKYYIRMSHYIQKMTTLSDRRIVRAEYDLIPYPTALTAGASEEPLVPAPHRRVLSFGTAFYLDVDKSSGRAAWMEQQFAQALEALVLEHERIVAGETGEYGSIPPAMGLPPQRRRLTSTSGLVYP